MPALKRIMRVRIVIIKVRRCEIAVNRTVRLITGRIMVSE